MPLIDSAVNVMRSLFGTNGTDYGLLVNEQIRTQPENVTGNYDMLRRLYFNDRAWRESGSDNITLGLRNPTRAVVDFYAATMWPGTLPDALPVETGSEVPDPEALIAAIHQVWNWSNWNARKQVYARNTAMLGDALMKIETRINGDGKVNRVYTRLIEPDYLTDFDVDERDYLTYIRLDVPRQRRNGDKTEQYTYTEVWDKESDRFRVWEHDNSTVQDIAQLGSPLRDESIESFFGFDFVPFVHSKHIDLGQRRGAAAITPALVKAHEANRMATRLHQLMFQYNKADLVLYSNLVDENGQPMPPPIIDDDGGTVEINGQTLWRLPSGWDIKPSIANLPYQDHLNVLNAHLEHLQQTDLPELAYYRIADAREMSGKAIRFMLTAAIAKAEEARGNAEAALIRANQMALTIGAIHNLPGFTGLGDFENGAFDHTFRDRSVVPLSEDEEAAVAKAKSETAKNRLTYGWTTKALLIKDGVDEGDAEDMLAELPAERLAGPVLDNPNGTEVNTLFEAAMSRGQ